MTKQIILTQLEMEHAKEKQRLKGIGLHPAMTPGARHLATANANRKIRNLERQMAEITRL